MPVLPVPRQTLPGAASQRLNYAQVHEDPRLELEVLAPVLHRRVVVVSSAGCTVLSLLAEGASDVIGVDLNITQNHLTELKAVSCARLSLADATAFLGGWPMAGNVRLQQFQELRPLLTIAARTYWDANPGAISKGVVGAGISERFMAGVVRVMHALVHPRSRVQRLLACQTLEAQRSLYRKEWNSRRWRWLFSLLLGRKALEQTYDSGMFANLTNGSFAQHFHSRFEQAVTEQPVHDNYFLHHALTGRYHEDRPLFLMKAPGAGHLTLVDAGYADFLRTQSAGSIGGFALSNICEWLGPAGIDDLFREIVRTAEPGAILCFRNFVGWTDMPERWRSRFTEDTERGDALLSKDRSLVNRRFVVCTVGEASA